MNKSLLKASFEDSKAVVTNGKYALTAGMPNPIHMSLLNRLFTVVVCGWIFFGILIFGLLFAMPTTMGTAGEVRYISTAAASLVRDLGTVLVPVSFVPYALFMASLPFVFWPKRDMTKQLYFYFLFYISFGTCAFVSILYFIVAAVYDGYGLVGLWIQLIMGLILGFWIVWTKIQNIKHKFYHQELSSILGKIARIVGLVWLILFVYSVNQHLISQQQVAWYMYGFGLLLIPWFIIYAYLLSFLIDVHIIQSYYILKYPKEYQAYLEIPDKEWYSKRAYRKMRKRMKEK